MRDFATDERSNNGDMPKFMQALTDSERDAIDHRMAIRTAAAISPATPAGFARDPGLEPRVTPIIKMVEAFVRTIKRDYIRIIRAPMQRP